MDEKQEQGDGGQLRFTLRQLGSEAGRKLGPRHHPAATPWPLNQGDLGKEAMWEVAVAT